MAPYFPLVQSSGTGKTKLMHEYKKMMDKTDGIHVGLILCHDGSAVEMMAEGGSSMFSRTLDISKISVDGPGRDELHLTKRDDGWHFRCIRWWLRLSNRPSDSSVVGVFAGTTTRLANYYSEPKPSTTSRSANAKYVGGTKLYPPCYQITTTGLVSRTDGTKFGNAGELRDNGNEIITEFDVATQYGRALFGRMHLRRELKDALGNILLRMRGEDKKLSLQKYYSLLATRLQRGQVSSDFASELVASGYAHLTYFSPEQAAVAEIAFLPDPGDVGEVAAAFYMLACVDELRYEQSPGLTQLSVPLEKWIGRLQQSQGADCETAFNSGEEKASVNFIQVCRHHLLHSLKEIQDSGLLRHWYLGGRASYAQASCQAYDMVVPLQYTLDGTLHYCPMLVSVKNRLTYRPKQRESAIEAMEKIFEAAGIETGVCMLLLVGLDQPSAESSSALRFSHNTASTVVGLADLETARFSKAIVDKVSRESQEGYQTIILR
ncbi:unnamed protein product [Cylindrotheca closterium]|uniref:Uncharacterized protein n=1 Tax=Cylindrotheca closterium TaxID=2856 RepID=A0AAD2CE88_9STRA|nr:unnamed protein product [Cylindrotheca closterium]